VKRLRAALLVGVLGVHGLAAAPVPHEITREDLVNPVTVEEITRWSERLAALGVAIPPAELGERLRDASQVFARAHRAVLAPFHPIFRLTGTGQGWALFTNPDTHPARLEIRVRRGASWEVLYRRLDPAHDWNASLLAFRRIRGVYDAGGARSKPRGPYKRFAAWIAARALADLPDVDEVEVRTLRTHTTLPGSPPDPKVEVRHAISVSRP
jgi:hypothetical protein